MIIGYGVMGEALVEINDGEHRHVWIAPTTDGPVSANVMSCDQLMGVALAGEDLGGDVAIYSSDLDQWTINGAFAGTALNSGLTEHARNLGVEL